MLSVEEIKLLIEKLEKLKGTDFEKLILDNLKILKELEETIDANNSIQVKRTNKTIDWFREDENNKHNKNKNINVEQDLLYNAIYTKIKHFGKTGSAASQHNSLEIGPGYGRFSKCFLPWRLNYFVDLLTESEVKIKKKFHPNHHKYIKFYVTNRTACSEIPNGSISFVFSWDTFVFFTQEHIKEYLTDLYRVILPGGYIFIQYTNCEYDLDLQESKRGYWNYNTKSAMSKMITETGYNIIEMDQFKPGANYAIFQKPGKSNTVLYKTLNLS
jgi:hypothetical protein